MAVSVQSDGVVCRTCSLESVQSRSECARYRDQIIAKIEQGLTAQRIYQDLVVSWRSKGTSDWRLKSLHLYGGGEDWPDDELLETRARTKGRLCPITWQWIKHILYSTYTN